MSHRNPHGFPRNTPEPTAQPYSAIDSLLDVVFVWVCICAACAGVAGILAFFFPDFLVNLLNSFR